MSDGLGRRGARLVLIALFAGVLLAFATGAASARRFEISEQLFRITWGSFIFRSTGNFEVTCQITLAGSYHSRTFSKVSGELIGHIAAMTVRTSLCEGGVVIPLTETLPWHIQYNSFSGALPNINEVILTIVGASIGVRNLSNTTCLVTTTQARPLFNRYTFSGGFFELVDILPEHTIPASGAALCAFIEPWRLEGAGRHLTQRNTQITLHLVQ